MSIIIPLVAADGAKSTITLPDPVVQPPTGSNPFPLTFPDKLG